jgi:hypothetical protein
MQKVKTKVQQTRRSSAAVVDQAGEATLAHVEVEVETHVHGKTLIKIEDHMAEVDRESPESTEMHGTMAIVEWWILAHANWLMGHSGTSFSETAAGVGLSPLGVMERVDIVHDVNHASTSYRRDWNGDSCTPVGGASPEHAANCPNLYLNNR